MKDYIDKEILEADENRAVKDIRNLMDSMKLTSSQAMDALKIPKEEQESLMKYV